MWFSGFSFLILSLIVEVYLWWTWWLQASLIFLSGRTCTIGGWLNTFLPHCMRIFTCICICAATVLHVSCMYVPVTLSYEYNLNIDLSVIWPLFYTVLLSEQLLPTLFLSLSYNVSPFQWRPEHRSANHTAETQCPNEHLLSSKWE